jgi:hypothetical protein
VHRPFADLWADLAALDAERAYTAGCELAAGGDDTVTRLRAKLPVAGANTDKARALIADLDSDDFARRESASRSLANHLGEMEPELRRALSRAPSIEQRHRLEAILRDAPTTGQWLRAIRATAVLERIGSPDARRFLGAIAHGDSAATLTREAQASLERMAGRTPPSQ